MSANQARFPIAALCRLLGVSTSGYYAWSKGSPSKRSMVDAALTRKIRTLHLHSKATYGAPRIHADLAADGIHVGRKRVARLMRMAKIKGISRRKFVTTTKRGDGRPAPDLVNRKFLADKPNKIWVADITYVSTAAGFLYLAVIIDVFSRRIIGWSMKNTLHAEIVLDALDMAVKARCPHGVIHHSDQGSQYKATAFKRLCDKVKIRRSMGSVGDCYDNAMAESFFATLECELLQRTTFKTRAAARKSIFEFIEGFYNRRRRHSSLGYLSPVSYENAFAEADPSTNKPAIVLAAAKDKPSVSAEGALIPDTSLRATAPLSCGPGRKNGDAGGQTKKWGRKKGEVDDHPTLP